jgi:hypothetical protein
MSVIWMSRTTQPQLSVIDDCDESLALVDRPITGLVTSHYTFEKAFRKLAERLRHPGIAFT